MKNLTPVLFLFACTQPDELKTGTQHTVTVDDNEDYSPYCEEVLSSLSSDEISPLGISMDQVLENLSSNYETPLVWQDGTEDCLSTSVTPDIDTIVYVESTEVYPEPPPGVAVNDIGIYCPDYISIQATLLLQTPNGELDEELDVELFVSETEIMDTEAFQTAYFWVEFDSFEGSLISANADETSEYSLSGGLGTEFIGSLNMTTSGSDGDSVWQSSDVLAQWGESEHECAGSE